MSSIPLTPPQGEMPVPVKPQPAKKRIRMWMICLVSVLLIVIGLVVFSLTRFDGDDPNFAGGYGTREKPYLISTPRQLDHLSQCLGMDFAEKYYKLENDIVFTPADFDPDGAFYNEGQGWTPIGNFPDKYSPEQAFCANFDGNGKTIEGLVCRTRQHRSVGLFGALYGASVSNLLLKNARIRNQCPSLYLPQNRHDRSATGALAGRAYLSRIQRVGVQADIEGFSASGQYRDMSGGLVGDLCNSRVEDCYTEGSVRESFYAGGIAGEAFSPGTDPTKNTLIERCFSTAALHGGTVGGIAATTAGDAPQTRIACCFALNKELIGNGQYAGIANVYSSTILTRNYRAETTLIKGGKADHHHGEPMSFLRSLDQATWKSLSFEFGHSPENPWTWVEGKYPELKFSWLDPESAAQELPPVKEPESAPDTFLVSTWQALDPANRSLHIYMFKADGQVMKAGWNVTNYKKRNDKQYDLFDAEGKYVQVLDVIDENTIIMRWNSPYGDVKATRVKTGKAVAPAQWVPETVKGSMAATEHGGDPNFDGGSGTMEQPYLISTPAQLDHLRQCLGPDFAATYYKLKNDIVFTPADFASGGAFYNEGQGWVPIGSFRDQYTPEKAFCGHFDGNGKMIEGLVCRPGGHRAVGLFGALYGASVSNLLLKNAHVRNQLRSLIIPASRYDRSATGAVAGRVYRSRIRRVGVQARVEGFSSTGENRDMTGGLVGELCNSRVEDCYTAGSVRDSFYVGGIAGEALSQGDEPEKSTQIERCFSTASLHAEAAGGIAGTTSGEGVRTQIGHCFALNKEITAARQGAGIANVYNATVLDQNDTAETTLINGVKITRSGANTVNGEITSSLRALDQATWESLSFEFGDSAEKPWTWVQGKYPELRFSWLATGSAGKSDSSQGPSPLMVDVKADCPAASAHNTPAPVQLAPETVKPLPGFSLVATWDGFDSVLQLNIQFIFTPDGKVTRTGTPLGWNVVSYKKKNDREYDLFDTQGKYVQKLEVIDENNIVLCWNSPLGDVKATRSNPGGTAVVKAAPPAEPQPLARKATATVQTRTETVKPLPVGSLPGKWDVLDPSGLLKVQLIFTPDGKITGTGPSPELNLSSYKKKNDQQYELFDADGKYVQMLEVIDERNMVLRGKSPEGDLKARRAFVASQRVVPANKQRNPIPPCSPEDAASLLDSVSQSNMGHHLKELLEKGVHPDVEVEGRAGALNTAVLRGKKEMIQLMLDKGADINKRDPFKNTALMTAVYSDNKEMTELLLSLGADPNINSGDGYPCLMRAVRQKNTDIVKLLLEHGADPDPRNIDILKNLFYPILFKAVQESSPEIVGMLIAKGADVKMTHGDDFPLLYALWGNRKDMVEVLIKHGAGPTTEWEKGRIKYAMADASSETLAPLIKSGCISEEEANNEALKKVVRKGNLDQLEGLLKQSSNPASAKVTALIAAMYAGQPAVVEFLLSKGVDLSSAKSEASELSKAFRCLGYLHETSGLGSLEIVKQLLEKGFPINDLDSDLIECVCKLRNKDVSLLFINRMSDLKKEHVMAILGSAVDRRCQETVEALLNKGLVLTEERRVDLLISVIQWWGSKKMVELILSQGVNLSGPKGEKMLALAQTKGRKEIIELLMTKGGVVGDKAAILKVADERIASTPVNEQSLQQAFRSCQKEVVEFLLSKGMDEDKALMNKFLTWQDSVYGLEFCLAHGAEMDVFDKSDSIFSHIRSHNIDVLKFILPRIQNIDSKYMSGGQETPLLYAGRRGQKDIVDLCLARGADVHAMDAAGAPILREICTKGYKNIIEALVQKGADINSINTNAGSGWSAVMTAAGLGRLDIVEYLVSKGADVNLSNKDGKTAYDIALEEGNLKVAQFLKPRTKKRTTAPTVPAPAKAKGDHAAPPVQQEDFLKVCAGGDKKKVESLLAQGVNINGADKQGRTGLMLACQKGHNSIVALLVAKGADVNKQTPAGVTALMVASFTGKYPLVQFLVKKGADVSLQRKDGKTALDIARAKGFKNLEALLTPQEEEGN